ncbi:MAG: UDP-N-acetylglucosamine 1-carboxyvinyltransferase, partial [[Eubacterium] siraeum]|nr:UDP-N-acetylglucosamine 1-carboxyvinyltransferase [[Eubacterium] siraeum]
MSEKCIVINGGNALSGSVEVRGAKNAVLPLLAVSILTKDDVIIENCPYISDIENMTHILEELGAQITREGLRIRVRGSVTRGCADEVLYKSMRSSMFMLGALLSVLGEVEMPTPGGCAIGARPLDIHLDGLRRMGAQAYFDGENLKCKAKRLHGANIVMRYPSVGATENLLMCASLAEGCTTLVNCAREPEIVTIAHALKSMGAKISGEGTSVMQIEGVKELKGATLKPCGDRIVAGTVLSATALCGGDVRVYGVDAGDLRSIIQAYKNERCEVSENGVGFRIRSDGFIQAKSVITAPFPLFPTDMQPQYL